MVTKRSVSFVIYHIYTDPRIQREQRNKGNFTNTHQNYNGNIDRIHFNLYEKFAKLVLMRRCETIMLSVITATAYTQVVIEGRPKGMPYTLWKTGRVVKTTETLVSIATLQPHSIKACSLRTGWTRWMEIWRLVCVRPVSKHAIIC